QTGGRSIVRRQATQQDNGPTVGTREKSCPAASRRRQGKREDRTSNSSEVIIVWSCLVFSTVDDYGCVRWRGGRCNGSADGRKSWCTGYEVTGRCQGGEPWTAFVCHLEPTALQVLLRTACHHGYSWSSSHQPYVSLSKPGCMGLLGVQKLGG
ncbi:unnamed protein product, partial [Ectocarpus fasciculatus]